MVRKPISPALKSADGDNFRILKSLSDYQFGVGKWPIVN
jgi:hypothetical protein